MQSIKNSASLQRNIVKICIAKQLTSGIKVLVTCTYVASEAVGELVAETSAILGLRLINRFPRNAPEGTETVLA